MGERRLFPLLGLVLFLTDIGEDCGICNSRTVLAVAPGMKNKYCKNNVLSDYFASGTAVAMSQMHQKCFTEDGLN